MDLSRRMADGDLLGLVLEPNAATRTALVEVLESLGVRCRFVHEVGACVKTLSGPSDATADDECRGVRTTVIVTAFAEAVEAKPALLDQVEDRVFAPPIVVTVDPSAEAAAGRFLSRSVWGVLAKPTTVGEARRLLASAVAEGRQRLHDWRLVHDFRRREQRLNDAERRVLAAVCEGKLNKQIAKEFGVSVRTVEQRRRRVFTTMGVASAAPLAERVATVRTLERLHAPRRQPVAVIGAPHSTLGLSAMSPVAGY